MVWPVIPLCISTICPFKKKERKKRKKTLILVRAYNHPDIIYLIQGKAKFVSKRTAGYAVNTDQFRWIQKHGFCLEEPRVSYATI